MLPHMLCRKFWEVEMWTSYRNLSTAAALILGSCGKNHSKSWVKVSTHWPHWLTERGERVKLCSQLCSRCCQVWEMWCAQEVLDSILAAAGNHSPWIGDASTKYLPTELGNVWINLTPSRVFPEVQAVSHVCPLPPPPPARKRRAKGRTVPTAASSPLPSHLLWNGTSNVYLTVGWENETK